MKKLLYVLGIAFTRELQYRFNFFLSIIRLIIPICINIIFWIAVYSNSGDSALYGYTSNNMIRYIISVNLINMVISVNFAYEVASDIHSGRLNNFVIKPISYTGYRLFSHLGSKLLVLGLFVLSSIVYFCLTSAGEGAAIIISRILCFSVGMILACILNNFMFYCISLSAFWFTQTGYMFWLLQELINLLSGAIFPLSIFGENYASISYFLPFQYIAYFPANIFLNQLTAQQLISQFAIQLIWICFFIALSKVLWKRGIKKYVAIGG